MAAPNLVSPTTINGKTARIGIGTTAPVGIVTNASDSGKVLKINSIFAANVASDSSSVNVSVTIYDGSTDFYTAKNIDVPPNSTQIIGQKDTYFYLEEGDQLRVTAGAADKLNIIVGYEDIS